MRHSRVPAPGTQEEIYEGGSNLVVTKLNQSMMVNEEPGCQEKAAEIAATFGGADMEENCGYPIVVKSTTGSMFLTFPLNNGFLDCKECKSKYEGHCLKHEPQVYVQDAGSNCTNHLVTNVASMESEGDVVKKSSSKEKVINNYRLSPDIKDSVLGGSGMGVRGVVARKFAPCVETKNTKAILKHEMYMDSTFSLHRIKDNNQTKTDCSLTVQSKSCNRVLDMAVCVRVEGDNCDIDDTELSLASSEPENNIGKDVAICDVCGMELTSGGSRRRHKIVLTGDKPYKCDICDLRFDCCSGMRTHKRIHTGEKPYKCETCAAAFTRGTDLNIHRRIHTGEKPYKCEVCNVAFTCSGHLIAHRRVHTGEKPFICGVCGVTFSVSSSLRSHILVHTGERPFRCDVCGFGFITGEGLKKHKRVHTGEKPYKCEHCPSQFTSASNLMRHSRVHSGLKPYKCEVCLVGFSCTSVLRKHERIHTGEKPYTCNECGMKFAASFTLAKHKKLHTGNNPYKCQVCGAGFTCTGNLTKHKRVHVGLKPK